MCGLAGFLDLRASRDADSSASILRRMCDAIRHRGPDEGGQWIDAATGIALGHRRLSILELSPAGAQPMASSDGRYVLAFNGEIYNHRALRAELPERAWRGRSDTESMAEAIAEWGVEKAVRRFEGMFAFALWDKRERALTLACDRMGEKPLYYGSQSGVFMFGSELKALRAFPGWKAEIDRGAVALMARFNHVPAPYCIHKGLRKLMPGEMVTLPWGAGGTAAPRSSRYWSAAEAIREAAARPLPGGPAEWIEHVDAALRKAVAAQMESDVPLGAFLSGGIDSSIIVALMQAQSRAPVKTFTIGFGSRAFDEAVHAREVAAHLGTDHHEERLEWSDALALIPSLPRFYDEPFADSSQLPTYLVARAARRHVTVCLSGDGGDELFGGYNRHSWGPAMWRRMAWVPRPLRRTAAAALAAVAPDSWDRGFESLGRLLPRRFAARNPGLKMHKLAGNLASRDPMDFYRGLVSHWRHPGQIVLGAEEPSTLLEDRESWPAGLDLSELMMYLDTTTYLPGDILVKVDRAAMAVSLETRIPFLDPGLFGLAWRLPPQARIRGGAGKWILRQILARYVPPAITERPKMGFAVPLANWMRGPLRDWAESLLSRDRLEREGIFNSTPIRRRWQQHLSGRFDWHASLWCVLMFQAWMEENARGPAVAA
jgi:asparagine synthase (glutamine-hydrolysing)